MTDLDAKERILLNAVRIFSEKGFHGTSMRDIAGASECSMPTLYYHYNSKNDLFDEIVVNQFLQITDKLNHMVDLTAEPEELYFQVIRSRRALNGFEKDVYKMALKVWLGFEGTEKAREKIMEWENSRASANRRFIDKSVKNDGLREAVTEILIGYMESIISKIILLDEDVDEEKVKSQIALLFQIGK